MVDDYHDFKYELLSWLAHYGKNPEKHEGLASSTLESTHYKLENRGFSRLVLYANSETAKRDRRRLGD